MGYDDTQREAVLTKCTRCGLSFYMTAPQPLCSVCRVVLAQREGE